MFKNYLVTVYRTFKRHPSFLLLNVLGLALGIGCSVVIYLIVNYELSYEKHHANFDHIYRVTNGESASVPHPTGDALMADYAFVDAVAKIDYEYGGIIASWEGDNQLKKMEEQDGLVFASPGLFDVFTFPALAGNLKKAVAEPNSAVISDEWATKYFGIKDGNLDQVIGKRMTINSTLSVVIKGVFLAPPATTDLPFQLVVHYDNLGDFDSDYEDGQDWDATSSSTNCYVLLKNESNKDQLSSALPGLAKKYYGEEDDGNRFGLQPLSDVHFNPVFGNFGDRVMDYRLLGALVTIAFFLVIAACINFINLSTAQASRRAREIGIRKAMGGHKGQLRAQFLTETFFITLLASFFSLALAEVMLLELQDLLGYRLSVSVVNEPGLLAYLVAIVTLVTLAAGLYPSLVLSNMGPVAALKGKSFHGKGLRGISVRKALVVFQFMISQALVFGTLVVLLQTKFLQDQPLGFDKEAIITTWVPDQSAITALRERIRAVNGVDNVSFCIGAPLSSSNSHANFYEPSVPKEQRGDLGANFKAVDENYLSLFNIELLAGRNLRQADSASAIIASEQSIHGLGFQTPAEAIGAKVRTGYDDNVREIVGVVKDFHAQTLHQELKKVILLYYQPEFYTMAIKFSAGSSSAVASETIAEVESIWNETFPEFIFDYRFLDASIAAKYETERNLATLFMIFACMAVLIGGLGLYGLISFMANERTKEIGVRKVLGAGTFQMLLMFWREVAVLLLIAFVVASPLVYTLMSNWLNDFAYQIDIGLPVFISVFAVSLLVALVSTGYRSMQAASSNPVDSLRSE
ncbi:FtsX-like permease family protein [Imperialibacter roseus]|uniref:FtsX-like permease family protein n=1 Tax=Imperialibacter roseus TaxID=1324217 RepID=A0ABZ0IWN8_9BACT|nr:FtsX-like permease family protein [Imperialibacter roseus]WOK09041.1 FtsX-like permease family protein [Imperialibacter roseus]